MRVCPHRRPAAQPILSGSAGGVCLLLLLLLMVATAAAETPKAGLRLFAPQLRGDGVDIALETHDLLAGDVLEALQAGLPVTVVVEWRIWHKREGWWDHPVGTGARIHRIRYDVLSRQFSIFDVRGRPLHTADSAAGAEAILCSGLKLSLRPESPLRADRIYCAEIRISVEALDDKEILDLESWLRGENSESARSLLGNVKNKATGWLKGIVGPAGRTAWAESAEFTGAE